MELAPHSAVVGPEQARRSAIPRVKCILPSEDKYARLVRRGTWKVVAGMGGKGATRTEGPFRRTSGQAATREMPNSRNEARMLLKTKGQ